MLGCYLAVESGLLGTQKGGTSWVLPRGHSVRCFSGTGLECGVSWWLVRTPLRMYLRVEIEGNSTIVKEKVPYGNSLVEERESLIVEEQLKLIGQEIVIAMHT